MFWSDVQKKWKLNILAGYETGKDTVMGFIYSNTDKVCPEEITEWFHGSQLVPDSGITVVAGIIITQTSDHYAQYNTFNNSVSSQIHIPAILQLEH